MLTKDCFVGRAAADDVAIGFWRAVRGEPEYRFERDVPMKAAVVAKDELIEIGVDMLAPQAVIDAPSAQRFSNEKARWLQGRTTLAAMLPTTRGSCR